MPWTTDAPPNVAANWTPDEQQRCVTAANAVVYDDSGTEEDAIFACIRAAGKSSKAMTEDELAAITAAEELKAGRRLKGGQVQALRAAVDALQSVLKWADYDDNPGNTHYKEDGMHSKALTEIKSTDKGAVIGGYMALWADEANPHDKDLQRDYFTPETKFYLEHYRKAPAMFHHGLDGKIGKATIGYRDDAKKDSNGLWVQDWIDKSNRFWNLVKPLLDAKKLYYSPGSVPHLVQREPTGQIKSYPIVDDTFTVTPIQIHMKDRPLDYVKAAYKEAGLTWSLPEELRGTSLQDGDVTSDDRRRQLAQAQLAILKLRS